MSIVLRVFSGAKSLALFVFSVLSLLWRPQDPPTVHDALLSGDREESPRIEGSQAPQCPQLVNEQENEDTQQRHDSQKEHNEDVDRTAQNGASTGITENHSYLDSTNGNYDQMSNNGAVKTSPIRPRAKKFPYRSSRSGYKNPIDFFDNEEDHSLPGVENLVPNPVRLAEDAATRRAREEIERQKEEQKRREAEERLREEANARLGHMGLRTPLAPFIAPLSQEWEAKVAAATQRGSSSIKTCAPEILDFQSRDFGRIVPPTEWLNDNSIQAATQYGADFINKAARVAIKKDTPKCVALNSFFWSQLVTGGVHKKERMLKRVWGLTPQNFLDVESIIIPINEHHHWTCILIRPKRREISYLDSFHTKNPRRVAKIYEFVAAFLGNAYKEEEWKNTSFDTPLQTNGYDCGMFVITNSILLALGLDPSGYSQADLPLQRRRIAAVIINGGFHGDFDLAGL